MSENQIKTRIIHKHDIAENWNKATGFIPKQAELIVYDDRYIDNDGNEVVVADSVKYKIGDGVHSVIELPFATIGQTSSGAGAEIFNDYENNTAVGNYSSVHGKSSKNFNSITKPEKIYYKAFPNTTGYDGTILKEISYSIIPPYNFDYIYLKLEEIYNPDITSKEIAIDIFYYAENGQDEIRYYYLDANGELRIPASELLDSLESWDSGEDLQVTRVEIAPCVNTDDVNLKAYAVTERGDIYDFESLQFTTDSTDALGEVNKVYSYVDSWGNTRYTLWQDYHPEWTQALPDEEPVKEVPTNDPIHAVILYEALVNGGESFSLADGEASTVFGKDNITKGYGAIASGRNSIAAANYSLALGRDTEARGPGAFAVGLGGKATGMYSFAANEKGVASGYASMVVGDHCASTNYYSISGGYQSKSSGHSAMAIGFRCEANGPQSVALGGAVKANGENSIAIGKANEANGDTSAAIGYDNKVSGVLGIAIGTSNINNGCGIGIGEANTISDNGYAFGKANKVYGYNAVAALGAANTITESAFNGAVALGHKNTVSGEASCALGVECKSKGSGSVALGRKSEANGRASIAAGLSAIANGTDSVAIGRYSKADGDYQIVIGRANAPISGKKAVLIVGTGMYDTEESRKNGLVVYEAGNVTIGADPVNAMDVVTKQYLENNQKGVFYQTDILTKGSSSKKIEFADGVIPLAIDVRDDYGESIIVDSTIARGKINIKFAEGTLLREGDYEIKLSNEGVSAVSNSGISILGKIKKYYSDCWGGMSSYIETDHKNLPKPDANGVIKLHIEESTYREYPDYGSQEYDHEDISYWYEIQKLDFIEKITKKVSPYVEVTIAERAECDLEITTIYHK